jgi:hypothetical protein
MTLDEFLGGLQLLRTHCTKKYVVAAEHDQFWVYPDPAKPLNAAEVEAMRKWGWFQEHDDATYKPTEGWTCYV